MKNHTTPLNSAALTALFLSILFLLTRESIEDGGFQDPLTYVGIAVGVGIVAVAYVVGRRRATH